MDFLSYIEEMKWWERLLILNLMVIMVSVVPYLVIDIVKGAGFAFFWKIAPITGIIGIAKATIVSFFYEKHPVFFHRFFHIILVALFIFALYWIFVSILFTHLLKIVI